jgi:serine/threonine protein kinase
VLKDRRTQVIEEVSVPDSDGLLAGRYRLVRRLAVGGMSTVWQAWDERLQRPVAVKQLHRQLAVSAEDGELADQRAMREARNTARLHHPNAIEVLDVVDDDGRPALVMQYVPSRSLQVIVREGGPLPAEQVARIGTQIAAALAAAHRAGVVHRDVKPGNVLIGEDGVAMLTDFGISHAHGDMALTSTGLMTGTPAYLAPEIARGAPSSEASDVYSLAATLYMAVEGNPPFGTDQNAIALLHRVASEPVPPPQNAGPLTSLLMRMMSPQPEQRPSMVEVANSLAALYASPDTYAPAPFTDLPTYPVDERTDAQSTQLADVPSSGALPALDYAFTTASRPIGRRATWLPIAAAVAVIALATTVAVVLLNRGGGGGNVAGGPNLPLVPRTSARTPTTSPATSTSEQSTPPDSTTPSTEPAGGGHLGAPTGADLVQAVEDYFTLVPGHLQAGWARLTQGFQRGTGKGLVNYLKYWHTVDRVQVRNPIPRPPHIVFATITIYYKNGHVVTSLYRFHIKRDHGVLKIAKADTITSRAGH